MVRKVLGEQAMTTKAKAGAVKTQSAKKQATDDRAENTPTVKPVADPIEEPGSLEGENYITLQTRHAQRVVNGRPSDKDRKKGAITGLTRFANLIKQVYYCAKLDDPYADLALIKIEELMEQAEGEMRQMETEVMALMNVRPNVSLSKSQSTKPVKVRIDFANPYAYRAAYLLAHFDDVCLAILTAHHVCVLPRQDKERLLNLAGRIVRRVYSSADEFRHTGATKEDIEKKTAIGLKAIELYGELPVDVLNGERRAKFAPDKIESSRVISRRVLK
jgi:integrating conjugative element protein (TIGR03761 family)